MLLVMRRPGKTNTEEKKDHQFQPCRQCIRIRDSLTGIPGSVEDDHTGSAAGTGPVADNRRHTGRGQSMEDNTTLRKGDLPARNGNSKGKEMSRRKIEKPRRRKTTREKDWE